MSSKRNIGIENIQSIRIKPNWTHCRVELWHSVRESPYWVVMDLRFSNQDDPTSRSWFPLGTGERGDHKHIFNYLQENGYCQVSRQVVQEWEYYEFVRSG